MNEQKKSNRIRAKNAKNLSIEPSKPLKNTSNESETSTKQETANNSDIDPPSQKKVKKQNGLFSPNAYSSKSELPASKLLEFLKQIASDPDSL